MRQLWIGIVALATVGMGTGNADASHRTLMYQAANAYRDAVREFERHVLRTPYIERQDERLVDDLEDHTSVLRTASRHPENSRRFEQAWFEAQSLQSRVEQVIFGRACYPRNLALEQCWQAVIYRYAVMAELVRCLQVNPRHTRSVVPSVPFVPSVYPLIQAPISAPIRVPVRAPVQVPIKAPIQAPVGIRVPTTVHHDHDAYDRVRHLTASRRTLGASVARIPSPIAAVPTQSVRIPTSRMQIPTGRKLSSAMIGAKLSRVSR